MLVLVLVAAAASVAWTTIGEQRGRIFILLLLQIESQQFATHQQPRRRLWCVVGYRVGHHPTHTLETRPTSDIIWSLADFLEDCATFYSAKFSWSTRRNVVINFTSSSMCGLWRKGSTGSVLYTVQSTLLVLQLLLLLVGCSDWVSDACQCHCRDVGRLLSPRKDLPDCLGRSVGLCGSVVRWD